MKNQGQMEMNSAKRKRGRPSGKNRVPLSMEERRARNAQYERERRMENAEAFHELAIAVGCETKVPNAEVLATVVHFLGRMGARHPSESIQVLRVHNQNLIDQIADLESRLGLKQESSDSESQYSYSSQSSYEPDVRTHTNNVGYKRVKMEADDTQYSYSSQSSYEPDVRTHTNNVGCKRVKIEDESSGNPAGDATLLDLDAASLSPLVEESSSSNDGVFLDLLRQRSIEELITQYL